jgi:hypothetical protein
MIDNDVVNGDRFNGFSRALIAPSCALVTRRRGDDAALLNQFVLVSTAATLSKIKAPVLVRLAPRRAGRCAGILDT